MMKKRNVKPLFVFHVRCITELVPEITREKQRTKGNYENSKKKKQNERCTNNVNVTSTLHNEICSFNNYSNNKKTEKENN